MDCAPEASSVSEPFLEYTPSNLKNFSWYRCSVDGRYVVALTAENVVVYSNRMLVFLDLKNRQEILDKVYTNRSFRPIDRLGHGSFLSLERAGTTSKFNFKIYRYSGRGKIIQNFTCDNNIAAFSAAGPGKFVYGTRDEYWQTVILSGFSVRSVKREKSSFKEVDAIAASGDLTAVSSKGASTVEFWKNYSVLRKTVYDGEMVCSLGRSGCWFFVKRQKSVVFYNLPYLDVTRVIFLDECIFSPNDEWWTVNIVPNESFAIIHCENKLFLFHILSGALVGNEILTKKTQDVSILPTGDILFALENSIAVVHPSRLSLTEGLSKCGNKNIWGTVNEIQRAMVHILTSGESAIAYCTTRDKYFNISHTIDEFIATFHILVLAFEEFVEIKGDYKMEALTSSRVATQLQNAHQTIRKRSLRHRKLADQYMKTLGEYDVISLVDMNETVVYDYDESEDICILQNTDVFNLHEKAKNKEGFVTRLRRIYQSFVESGRKTSLAAVAIEIICFTQYFFVAKQNRFSEKTVDASVQDFSNYLLGLQGWDSEMDASTLTGRLFRSTVAAIHFSALQVLDDSLLNIWKESLFELDLSTDNLAELFKNNC